MKNIKEAIGHRIRNERERQGLTRLEVCGSESEITIKQLMRIELGQSLPTIVKLEFLSNRLNVDMAFFLGEERLEIPQDYFDKKYRLVKSPVYGDSTRIKEKKEFIEDISNKYCPILPEEELLSLDIIERSLDLIDTGVDEPIEDIFEDYFEQVLIKDNYSFNDLLLIAYFTLQCQDLNYQKDKLEICRQKLLNQDSNGDEMYNVELMSALTGIAGVYVIRNDYEHMKSIVDKLNDVAIKTQQLVHKPGILMLEAKYYVYHENNKTKAEQLYDTASLVAEQFGDNILLHNLESEKAKDLGI